jgi:hypothetical protein
MLVLKQGGAPVKAAEEFLNEVLRQIRPPKGCPIVLRECKSEAADDPNWVLAAGNMPADARYRCETAVTEMRRQHPRLDWGGISGIKGKFRRIAIVDR